MGIGQKFMAVLCAWLVSRFSDEDANRLATTQPDTASASVENRIGSPESLMNQRAPGSFAVDTRAKAS